MEASPIILVNANFEVIMWTSRSATRSSSSGRFSSPLTSPRHADFWWRDPVSRLKVYHNAIPAAVMPPSIITLIIGVGVSASSQSLTHRLKLATHHTRGRTQYPTVTTALSLPVAVPCCLSFLPVADAY